MLGGKVKCSCGQEISYSPEEAGKKIRCNICGELLSTPGITEGTTIPCPFCSEQISPDVSRCPHCSEFLRDISTGQILKKRVVSSDQISHLEKVSSEKKTSSPLLKIAAAIIVLLLVVGLFSYLFMFSAHKTSAKWRAMVREGHGNEYNFRYRFTNGETITSECDTAIEMDVNIEGTGQSQSVKTQMVFAMIQNVLSVDSEGNASSELRFRFKRALTNGQPVPAEALSAYNNAKIFATIDPKGRAIKGTVRSENAPADMGEPEKWAAQFLPPVPLKPIKEGAVIPVTEVVPSDYFRGMVPDTFTKAGALEADGVFSFKEIISYRGKRCAKFVMEYEVIISGKIGQGYATSHVEYSGQYKLEYLFAIDEGRFVEIKGNGSLEGQASDGYQKANMRASVVVSMRSM